MPYSLKTEVAVPLSEQGLVCWMNSCLLYFLEDHVWEKKSHQGEVAALVTCHGHSPHISNLVLKVWVPKPP